MKDQVLFFLPTLDGGGAERIVLTLCDSLSAMGARVTLAVASSHGQLRDLVNPDLHLVDLQSSSTKASIFSLARLLNDLKPSSMLSTLPHGNVTAILARSISRANVKLVIREAGSSLTTERQSMGTWASKLACRLLYPAADEVVAVSIELAEELETRHPRLSGRVRTIYNPTIDDTFFQRANEPIQHPWLTSEVPTIVTAGRLSHVKGFDILLRAFARVSEKRECRLIILGEGPERGSLKELTCALGIEQFVDLPGFVPNPLPYFRKSDLFVLSSRREGLPNALIQALACSPRIVSTDCRTGPSEILCSGTHGVIVPPNDPEALAGGIEQALDQPPASVQTRNTERFQAIHIIPKYASLLLG